MPGWIGMPELIVLLVAALILFGPRRLPEIGKSMGSGIREFKDSVTGTTADDQDTLPVAPPSEERTH